MSKKKWTLASIVLAFAPFVIGAKGCDGAPTPCGGIAGEPCAKGQYCKFAPETRCGSGDQMGVCAAMPDICPDIWRPVCGCDGRTYGNDCEAAAAGVSVISEGECGSGATCGGFIGRQCPKGEYCNYPPHCGFADGSGTCATIPDVCTEHEAPVCGCDGRTYGNRCKAAAAGVSVRAEGECGR